MCIVSNARHCGILGQGRVRPNATIMVLPEVCSMAKITGCRTALGCILQHTPACFYGYSDHVDLLL